MTTIKNLVLGFSSSHSSSEPGSIDERHEHSITSNGSTDSGFLDQSSQLNNETSKKLSKAFGKLLTAVGGNDDENNNITHKSNGSGSAEMSIFGAHNVVQGSQAISSVIINSAMRNKVSSTPNASNPSELLSTITGISVRLKVAFEDLIQVLLAEELFIKRKFFMN